MIEDEHLKYLLNEEIYVVKEKNYAPPKIAEISHVHEPDSLQNEELTPPKEKIFEVAVWTSELSEADKQLLTKMLTAVKIDFSAICLMEGLDSYKPNYIKLLCFGLQNELQIKMGKELQDYHPTLAGDQQILCAPSLGTFHNNDEGKRKLWGGLQKMFLS